MSDGTSIQWTDATWGITRGCSRVSAGCGDSTGGGCYAERMAHRFSGHGRPFEGLTRLTSRGPRWTGVARFVPEMLDQPLRWRRPRKIFVSSMSDLFHDDIAYEQISAVFGVMAACRQHTFQILTKRPERMLKFFMDHLPMAPRWELAGAADEATGGKVVGIPTDNAWPLPNVWLGVSVENQKTADERLPILLQTPASVRFASMEPLLGRVMFTWRLKSSPIDAPEGITWDRGLDWVIVGGESGPGARPCALEWIEFAVQQCQWHDVPVFVKQLGAYVVSEDRVDDERAGDDRWAWRAGLRDRKGGEPSEWPEHLNIRQFPEVRHD